MAYACEPTPGPCGAQLFQVPAMAWGLSIPTLCFPLRGDVRVARTALFGRGLPTPGVFCYFCYTSLINYPLFLKADRRLRLQRALSRAGCPLRHPAAVLYYTTPPVATAVSHGHVMAHRSAA